MRGDGGRGSGHAAKWQSFSQRQADGEELKAYLTSFIVSISSLMLAIRLFVNAASVRNNTFLRPLQLQKDQMWSIACFVGDLGTVLQNYLPDLNFGDALGTIFPRPSISALNCPSLSAWWRGTSTMENR
jgi:hypothetical protein